ncbi:myc-family transcription factor [Scheffersomyces stipitis CBS 6054]|uniref:Myc-family transcription factor n=1 Tax=Scheffersomyces stipitis (strain ATCC 58785 / CBS 6054 / NBRC 10063 / NRRL Y-11545) TaxID=322104 RepID=A3GFA3_PICST|nr:myc-family transcription factor [Scheffersomyces stipitis CBS 6054]EAZ63720.2 myc-family transcription factor [Scheffersomyces stipitis CBS 6054]
MESSVWNSTFSPSNSGATPGKSPYYHELGDAQQHHQQQQHHDATGSNSHSTPSSHYHQMSGPGPLPSGGTPSNFSDTEQLFLHQLEQNLYEAATSQENTPSSNIANTPNSGSGTGAPGIAGYPHDIPPPPQSYEYGIENMNFIIPEDLNFDTDPSHESSAFPPSHLPIQTPSMLAANKNLATSQKSSAEPDRKSFVSPILPGQNEKSYNNQHFYHKHNSKNLSDFQVQHQSQQAPQQHVRPDAVFTPLVSPAVTPLDSQVNLNKAPNASSGSTTGGGSSSSTFSQQPPVQVSFEPLTSPALNAQPSLNDRRRSSSSVYGPGPVDDHHAHTIYNGSKRRTPHGTPIMHPNKNSPSIKARNGSGNFRTSPAATSVSAFDELPESSMETSTNDNSNSATPMLPPQGKKIDTSNGGQDVDDIEVDMTSNAGGLSRKSSRSSRKSFSSNTSNKILPKSSSSSTETSPKLLNEKSSNGIPVIKKSGEKPATKKASHKLAEQGRRNRMNMAVSELGSLIPQVYHDEVAIPSKATTVELASKYIRALLQEIDTLKNKS